MEVVSFIENIINKYKISRVYTHDPHDRHQDHRSCSRAVSAAARKVPEILLFQGPSTLVTFEPHYFIELTEEHIKKKINALKSYKSQIKKNIVDIELIKYLAGVNGHICNTRYAEAFAINHMIEGGENV
jgi:LmbE family N-acetylglucosaminyl deacetylase